MSRYETMILRCVFETRSCPYPQFYGRNRFPVSKTVVFETTGATPIPDNGRLRAPSGIISRSCQQPGSRTDGRGLPSQQPKALKERHNLRSDMGPMVAPLGSFAHPPGATHENTE